MRSTILCFLDNPDEFMLLYSRRMEETRENFEYDGAWKEEVSEVQVDTNVEVNENYLGDF